MTVIVAACTSKGGAPEPSTADPASSIQTTNPASPAVPAHSDPLTQADEPETGPEQQIVVGGAVLTVPGGWTVFDVDATPDVQCRLFNHGRPLYVGTAPIDVACPGPVPVARPDPGIVARPASAEPFSSDVVASGVPVRWGDFDGWMVEEEGDILRMVFPKADLFLVQVNMASGSDEVESVLETLQRVAMVDIAQTGHGIFTEGSFSFIEVSDPSGETIAEQAFGPSEPIMLQVPIVGGPISVRAYQRACDGACPTVDDLEALDPIGIECQAMFDVGTEKLVRVNVDGGRCAITRVEVPKMTPRRCLPNEVALTTGFDTEPDGAIAMTTEVANAGHALCEVVLDDVYAALTDGPGHLIDFLDLAGNTVSMSVGSAALFPGETVQIIFDWRNSCGDYAAVTFQLDIGNVGSSDTGIPYPECHAATPGAFGLFDVRALSFQPEGTCQAVMIHRVDSPYPSAREALAAELDGGLTAFDFEDFRDLSELSSDDFLAILRTDVEVTFRLVAEEGDLLLIRSRRLGGGWGVDFVTECTA